MAGTVGVTLLQTRGESTTTPGAVSKPSEAPAALVRFGVPATASADLTRDAGARGGGPRGRRPAIFVRYRSLQARSGRRSPAGPRRPRRAEAARRLPPPEPRRAAQSRMASTGRKSPDAVEHLAGGSSAIPTRRRRPGRGHPVPAVRRPACRSSSSISVPSAVTLVNSFASLAHAARAGSRANCATDLLWQLVEPVVGRPRSPRRRRSWFRRTRSLARRRVGAFSKRQPRRPCPARPAHGENPGSTLSVSTSASSFWTRDSSEGR